MPGKPAKIIAELEAVDRRRASLRTGPTSILAADRPVEAFREASLMIRREVVDWAVQVRFAARSPWHAEIQPGQRGDNPSLRGFPGRCHFVSVGVATQAGR